MKTHETLLQVCESTFFPLNIRLRSEETRYQYRLAFRDYGKFLGHEPTLADLRDDPITAWMSRNLDRGLAAITVRERAGRIQTLWSWLAKRGVVKRWPTFIKPECPDSLPSALDPQQLTALFCSAAKERGMIGSVPADLWWLSFLAFVWNTAERKSAALAVRPQWLTLEDSRYAKASIPPEVRKGRKKHATYDLWPETVPILQAVLAVDPGRERVWPFPYSMQSYYTRYNRILKGAGIPVNRKTKTHALRVTHATYREVAGGDATRQLMHGDRATTVKSYIDPRMSPPDTIKMFVPWQLPPAGPPRPAA
jgi:hypothetical protein